MSAIAFMLHVLAIEVLGHRNHRPQIFHLLFMGVFERQWLQKQSHTVGELKE
jgi:hypothetical protein